MSIQPEATPRRTRHTISALILTGAAIGFVLSHGSALGASPRLYKWVDEHGQIHYSDSVPPEDVGRGRSVLNQQGVTVRMVPPAKTPEQIEEDRRQAEIQAEIQRQRDAAIAHDRLLLDTYNEAQDIDGALATKLAAIDAMIRLASGRIDSLRKQLDAMIEQAAAFERTGRNVPAALTRDIQRSRRQIAENVSYVDSKHAEQLEIRKQFAKDKQRFLELTADEPSRDDAARR